MTDQTEQVKRRPDNGKNILRRLIQVSMSIIIILISCSKYMTKIYNIG